MAGSRNDINARAARLLKEYIKQSGAGSTAAFARAVENQTGKKYPKRTLQHFLGNASAGYGPRHERGPFLKTHEPLMEVLPVGSEVKEALLDVVYYDERVLPKKMLEMKDIMAKATDAQIEQEISNGIPKSLQRRRAN